MRARQRIERTERLVEQQYLRLHGERTRDAHALLHAARDLRRLLVARLRHAHELEIAQRPFVTLRLGHRAAEDLVHGQAHVLVDAEPRQQRVILEHDGAIGPGLDDLAIVDEDVARRRRRQPRDDVEQRGLAAARVADDRDELALPHDQRHVA